MSAGSTLRFSITGKGDDPQPLMDPAERLRTIQDKAKKRGFAALTPEERSLLTADSVRIPAPGNNAIALPVDDDRIVAEMMLEVRVSDIDLYERNPRKSRHEKYDDLKQLIRVQGLLHVPPLTRRPGSQRWTLASGGNTRIQIVQELWEETRDPQFEKFTFLIKPWRGEGKALLAHIVENDQRSDLCFWDKAHALQDLQDQIALERGIPALSLRDFEGALTENGFRVNRTTLGCCRFVVSRLKPLVGCASRISGTAVQTILQPRLNSLSQLLAKADLDQDSAHTRVLSPAMQVYVDTLADPQDFLPDVLCQHLTAATAQALGRSISDVERMLGLLITAPDLTLGELTQALDARAPRTTVSTGKQASGMAEAEQHALTDPAAAAQTVEEAPETHLAHAQAGISQPHARQPETRSAQPHTALQITQTTPNAQPPAVARDSLAEAQQIAADMARRFACCFGADHLYRADAAMPAGYCMEPPPAQTPIEDHNTAMAYWWLVQCSRHVHAEDILRAEPSRDRQSGSDPGDADTPVRWVFSPGNTAIEAFLGLLRACHTLYSLAPEDCSL